MISLPVVLPGPMFLPGGLCPLSHVPSGVGGVSVLAPMFLPGGSLSGGMGSLSGGMGSLSGGEGVSFQVRSLSGGLCPGRSLSEGSLSRGSLCQGDHPCTVKSGRYAS